MLLTKLMDVESVETLGKSRYLAVNVALFTFLLGELDNSLDA